MSIATKLNELKGRVAIVTGATAGLGWATTLAFAAESVRVVATGRRLERLQALQKEVREMGGECEILAGDAADPETAAQSVSLAISRFGHIDILVNNAGQGNYKTLVNTTPEEYDELMNSNMKSTFLFTRSVASHMMAQRSGTIVVVSSVAGLAGAGNEAVYSASKFAQLGFAQSIDEELRPHGIKVLTLCPGGIKTEFAVGRGRVAEDVLRSPMMDAAHVADTILFGCMQPSGVRIPQLIVRHMGRPI